MSATKCGGCLNKIQGRRYLTCCTCEKKYDLVCANVPEARYNSFTVEQRAAWRCVECISNLPKKDNTNTPVRELPDGVARRRGAIFGSEEPNPTDNAECHDNTSQSKCADLQSFALELRLLREEMFQTRQQMQLLNNTMAALASRVDGCEVRIDKLTARTDKLEQRMTERLALEDAESSLHDSVRQLKAELNDRDQELLSNDVEISCVPETKGERLPHIVLTLTSKLGLKLTEEDLVNCVRVGSLHNKSEADSTLRPRPRPIVVRLSRRSLRDQLLREARARRGATTEGADLPGPPHRFYVNERLTRLNRQLFNRARELGRQRGWKYVWTRDGKVFARKQQGVDSPRHRIRTENDIVRVFGSNVADHGKEDVAGSSKSANQTLINSQSFRDRRESQKSTQN